jgi:hypothetical protein
MDIDIQNAITAVEYSSYGAADDAAEALSDCSVEPEPRNLEYV